MSTRTRKLRTYLLKSFPLGQPFYMGRMDDNGGLMVDQARDANGNYHNLSRGVPAIHPRLLKMLDAEVYGFTADQVREAIEIVRGLRALNGPTIIQALESFIYLDVEPPVAHARTLERWRDQAIDAIESILFKPTEASTRAAAVAAVAQELAA